MNISKSKNFKEEYCATIVQIGETSPIPGKDRIVQTLVNGLSIVIGKDEFKTGDVAVYCANETVLHELFLHLNSMYDERELNADKLHRGYINHYGRIRCIRLGGVPSYGIILSPQNFATFLNEPVEEIKEFLNKHIGEDFDEINGERFVKVYIPPTKAVRNDGRSRNEKRNDKLKRFKMLIEGSFRFHYDTGQLNKHIGEFNPDDVVDISTKIHGTSICAGRILTNVPTNIFKRLWRRYITHAESEYDQKYNLVYSSRTVIKNQYINKNQGLGYYSDDIWGYWAKKLENLIPDNYCIYGEIVGFTPKGSSIQKGYDYGCVQGQSKLMIYRVTFCDAELEIEDVIAFGRLLKQTLGDELIDFPLMYHGTLYDLYPEIPIDEHWHENVLEALKTEKRFHMEEDEELCNNKVPREGFVIRKYKDPVKEAWKLKCDAFKFAEAKQIDAGEVDIEITETNYEGEQNNE